MSIYRISYLSDSLKVYAYLGIPTSIRVETTQIDEWLQKHFGTLPEPTLHVTCTYPHIMKDAPQYTINHDVEQEFPGLVYCRGGIGRVGQVRLDWVECFITENVVVIAPCYRGSEGGEGRDEFGGADVADSTNALQFLQSLPIVQNDEVTILGFSRGSINATLTALLAPIIRHLVLWGGVSDLAATYNERVDLRKMLKRVIGGTPLRRKTAYESRSPVLMAQFLRCPVLLIHGRLDVQVDVSHALQMQGALVKTGKRHEIHIYDNLGHHMPREFFLQVIRSMFQTVYKES